MNVDQLLKDVFNGSIVLPDFQRSFIWEPEDVRELLVSVLGDYFIGSMLLLEHFKDESPFALRLVEGVVYWTPKAGHKNGVSNFITPRMPIGVARATDFRIPEV